MHSVRLYICLLVALFAFYGAAETRAGEAEDSIGKILSGQVLPQRELLEAAYLDKSPLWFDGKRPGARARELRVVLERAGMDGLNPKEYMLDALAETTDDVTADEIAAKDVAVTLEFAQFISDLSGNKSQYKIRDYNGDEFYSVVDYSKIFSKIRNGEDLENVMAEIAPQNPEYKKLKEALAKYQEFDSKGGFSKVTDGTKIEPAATGERVAQLRTRLYQEGFISNNSESQEYDNELMEAVKQFQSTRGITPDGVVGKSTIAALNKTTRELVSQLVIAMDRWRSLPENFGDKYVMVNLAGFYAEAFEGGKAQFRMKTINGEPSHPTPMMISRVNDVIFFPHWYVPKRIAVQKLLPKIHNDPEYLASHGYRVYENIDSEKVEVDPASIDWQTVDTENFQYSLKQNPGGSNSLGRIKFNLVNDQDIYMHGTPEAKLFGKDKRSLSSGCVRLENPSKMAAFAFGGQGEWTEEKISEYVSGGYKGTSTIKLEKPFKVYVLYFTSWIDEGGRANFVPDVYSLDQRASSRFSWLQSAQSPI